MNGWVWEPLAVPRAIYSEQLHPQKGQHQTERTCCPRCGGRCGPAYPAVRLIKRQSNKNLASRKLTILSLKKIISIEQLAAHLQLTCCWVPLLAVSHFHWFPPLFSAHFFFFYKQHANGSWEILVSISVGGSACINGHRPDLWGASSTWKKEAEFPKSGRISHTSHLPRARQAH